jgi:hypothetical protein
MRKGTVTWIATAGFLLVALLWTAPGALAVSALDQYQEGIPTAGGHEPSADTQGGGAVRGGRTSTISPATRAQLEKIKKGSATAKLAQATAPSRSASDGSGESDGGSGLGLILPLILGATLLGSLAIFIAHRRRGATPT